MIGPIVKLLAQFILWIVIGPLLYFLGKFWPVSLLKQRLSSNLGNPRNSTLERYFMTALLESSNKDAEQLGVKRCNVQPSDKVLEVGFGPGLGIQYAASLINKEKGGRVYGVDLSQAMVETATNKVDKEIKDGLVKLFKGSVDKLPFDDGTFDKVFHCNVFYFWEDRVGCCKELLRVIKPGGVMVTTADVRSLAAAVGMDLLSKEQTHIDSYMLSLQRAGFIDVKKTEEYVAGKLYACIHAHTKPV